jgi:hypothetical protein
MSGLVAFLTQLFVHVTVEGGGSSRAVTRLHTMIGLTGYRTRDLLRLGVRFTGAPKKHSWHMWPHTTYVPNYATTTAPSRSLPGSQPGSETNAEGGGSSRAVTRLHTMIGLTGYRTRDLLRIRRTLHRRTEKA